ncbi:MAG TPA: saccharopine dehydrogenase NADP-binding domain-containing protein [Kiritimatiellia bacterium]|nr:saccharopine dehydrogenase NADP-binding domain-containing protein [Kiritimatiellia bacterium]
MTRAYVVLGGCGAMGRIAVRDLFATDRAARITIGDYNEAGARRLAASFKRARVRAVWADASDAEDLANRLRGHDVVLNCTQHDFNLSVMRASLQAGCHYVDLGGLFTWTRKQLKLHGVFKRAGLVAIPGMGGSPGITNVLARWAAEGLGSVRSIRVRSCWYDPEASPGDFSFGFSPQTVVEELTLPAFALRAGRFVRIPPRSRWEQRVFPKPFGSVWCLATRHSEVATLPDSFRDRGVRSVDFLLGYDRAFVREFERRWKAGWRLADFKPLVASREHTRDLEILRVEVEGDGKRVTADCVARAKPAWRASSGDIDTGCPPSIVAQMLARGEIAEAGVHAPENIVPVTLFLRALRARGMTVRRRVQSV